MGMVSTIRRMAGTTITWLPRYKRNGHAASGAPQAADNVPTKPEAKELAKIVPEMRKDYQVTFCETVLHANASAIEVAVTGDNATLVEKLQTLWDQTGKDDDIPYGRVAFELEWDEVNGVQYPRKATAFAFEDSRMKLGEDGSFAGIEYRTKQNEWDCVAPVNAWWMALDATAKYPHGNSRFLDAPHEVWKKKRAVIDSQLRAAAKWASRGPIISGPTEVIDTKTQQPRDTMEIMAPAIDTWSRGGLLFLPNDTHPSDPTKPAWTVVQADLQGFDPNALNTMIDSFDVQMLRAFGIPEKTVIEGQAVGSYAMVTQQMRILFAVIEGIVGQRVESFKKYVLRKVEEVNGLPKGTLDIDFAKLSKMPDAFVYKVIETLLANPAFQAGLISGGLDVGKILKDAGLPVSEEIQARIATALQSVQAINGQAPAAAPGEFGNMGRRQLQNNLKAIRDILQDLIAGNITELQAREYLQTLGLAPERVDRLIGDAQDNATIDDPELQQAAATMAQGMTDFILMAQVVIPRQGFKVPQASQIVSQGLREFARLYDELVVALSKKATLSTINAIRMRIVQLEADMRTAGRVLGMLSPWQPRVNTYADGAASDATEPMTLASKWRWPWIDDAVAFLESKDVVTAEQFARMADEDKRHVFHAPGIDTAKQLKSIQESLAKSVELGEDLSTFRKRIGAEQIEKETALTRAHTETLFRTETKRGYVAGFDKAMRSPLVAEEFPAVLYTATPDQRVRDSHWELDGTVVLRSDTAAYNVLLKASQDYSCRCSMIPLSMGEAESRGIKGYSDLPSEAKAKYG